MTAKNLPAGSSFANKSPGTSPDELIAQYTFCGAYSTACYHQTFSGSYFPVTLVFPNGACSNNGRGRWPGLGSVWEVVRGTNWVFLLTMHWIRDAHVVKTSQQAELLTPSRTREDAYVAPCDGCGEGPQPEAWTVDPQHAVTCHHRVRLGVCGVGYDEVVVQMEDERNVHVPRKATCESRLRQLILRREGCGMWDNPSRVERGRRVGEGYSCHILLK